MPERTHMPLFLVFCLVICGFAIPAAVSAEDLGGHLISSSSSVSGTAVVNQSATLKINGEKIVDFSSNSPVNTVFRFTPFLENGTFFGAVDLDIASNRVHVIVPRKPNIQIFKPRFGF